MVLETHEEVVFCIVLWRGMQGILSARESSARSKKLSSAPAGLDPQSVMMPKATKLTL